MNTDCKCTCHDNADHAFVKIKGVPMKLKNGTVIGGYRTKGQRKHYLRVVPVVVVEDANGKENDHDCNTTH